MPTTTPPAARPPAVIPDKPAELLAYLANRFGKLAKRHRAEWVTDNARRRGLTTDGFGVCHGADLPYDDTLDRLVAACAAAADSLTRMPTRT